MRKISIAAIQMAMSWDLADNVARATKLVREAAKEGAQIVVLPEFFETPYFCLEQVVDHFALARPFEGNPLIAGMSALAKELGIVLPISFFEKAGQAHFNALAMIDADGWVLGRYRKSHIPAGPGYQEKYYFNPGDSGFRVFKTKYGVVGAGICWDQWFPECARAMALMGAEILVYPTAIGTEPPPAPPVDSRHHWRRTMQGHAAANYVPLVAANRIGTERGKFSPVELTFYGTGFITDPTGAVIADCSGKNGDGVISASFDLDAIAAARTSWGLFRDRRPDLYHSLLTLDGMG